jgi:hypothetical protein
MVEYLKDWIQELDLETVRNSYEIYEAAPDRQLQSFLDHIDEMIKITIKEIQGEPLNTMDYSRIRGTGFLLEMVGSERNPAIAADVYTNPFHGKVLEEAIGYPQSIYVVVPNHEGELRLTRGAIYSHYEFQVGINNRLTKEEWGKMLRNNPPDTHDWTKYLMA